MNKIRTIRRARQMTVKELAASTECAPMTIYRYERGERSPELDTAARIARTLGCTVDELLEPQPQEVG